MTEAGFRSRGKSRDSRDDLRQAVIGMAVTRDGIPVSGTVRQTTELTKPQHDLFTALAIDPPRRIQELATTR